MPLNAARERQSKVKYFLVMYPYLLKGKFMFLLCFISATTATKKKVQ